MYQFIVGTGIVCFPIEAPNPRQAIYLLKKKIGARRTSYSQDIGLSLVEALDAGRLNFVVFDQQRQRLFAGELNGEFQEPPSPELIEAMRVMIPMDLAASCQRR